MDRYSKAVFQKSIKAARTELGLTQEVFAQKIGISPSNINCWERGKAFPSSKIIDRIVNVYGIRKEYLLLGQGEII